jgi:tetratricopeptide (TPR) repeat protein
MKKILSLSLVLLTLLNHAQTKAGYKEYFKEGSFLLLEENYDLALTNFKNAYQIDSSNANINYNVGFCYLNSSTQKVKAESYLEKAVKNISKTYKEDDASEKSAPSIARYYYAKALHLNYKFDEALTQFNLFEGDIKGVDKEWKKELAYDKAACMFAKEASASPLNLQITNVGDSINGEYPDFSPVLSADERMMIYTTRRPNTTGGEKDNNGFYYEDVVVSYKDDNGKWSKPANLSPYINTRGMEASINLSPDGQTLIVYRDAGEGGNGNIYYSTWDGVNWSSLQEFGSDVNTKYWESHACLSADGRALYFVSDRPGGYGGKDIYRCIKLPNGKWSKALNLGKTINTAYNEDGAFIHPDGKTFFFTSEGHKTMGGYDIMFATMEDENHFVDITNMGSPINTPDDDVFYTTSPDGRRAYFSSSKDGGFGEKDIYMISIPDAKEKALALFKGQIIPADGEKLPEEIIIVVTDKNTGEVVGTYRPKMVNGTFTTILPPGREYNFSYQTKDREEFYNEDVFVTNDLTYQEIKREVNLEPVKLVGKIRAKSKAIILNTIVLNNPKNKKNVPGASIVLQDAGGASQNFVANENGRYEGVTLKTDNTYIVYAESDGKKSKPQTFNTNGIKSAKIINQILYIDGAKASASSGAVLDVLVVNNAKAKKPITNANITLMDADGNKYQAVTDAKGKVKGIDLMEESNYELSASKDAATSEKVMFTTNNLKGVKVIKKTLYLDASSGSSEPSTGNASTVDVDLPNTQYEFYFKFNKNKIDEAATTWTNFISKAVEMSKEKVIVIAIKSSASYVPTRAFRNNKALAQSRARKTQDKILEAIVSKGGNSANIKFKRSSRVGGPKYRSDFRKRKAKYEKHQYVKAKVTFK